jgi:hypothetical protein
MPRTNAFYVQEFQMGYAAEEAARFLHSACRGLPLQTGAKPQNPSDRFYTQILEHALGFFGSRALYPPRAAELGSPDIAIARCDQLLASAPRLSAAELDENAQNLGYALGSSLYNRYLEGRLTRIRLRQLLLTHLREPGTARKICAELIGIRPARKGPYSDHSARARLGRPRTA